MIEQLRHSDELKSFIFILNQIFEIERKVSKIKEANSIDRNIQRLKECFEDGFAEKKYSLTYHNPIGEKFDETRTDCEASIAGVSTENLIITEVIKPIIRIKMDGRTYIVQRAIVVVEEQNS
ncbi:hypothetical protein JXJ21_09075 [candidate division KSB1 bacterium]|nr:hypothetical protein [candidate division KSB1 bacterium]